MCSMLRKSYYFCECIPNIGNSEIKNMLQHLKTDKLPTIQFDGDDISLNDLSIIFLGSTTFPSFKFNLIVLLHCDLFVYYALLYGL